MKPLEPVAAAKAPYVLRSVNCVPAFLVTSDEFLHSFSSNFAITQIPFADGLPHQLRNSRVLAARAGVEGIPKMVVEIELGAPHDVYYTSSRMVLCARA